MIKIVVYHLTMKRILKNVRKAMPTLDFLLLFVKSLQLLVQRVEVNGVEMNLENIVNIQIKSFEILHHTSFII